MIAGLERQFSFPGEREGLCHRACLLALLLCLTLMPPVGRRHWAAAKMNSLSLDSAGTSLTCCSFFLIPGGFCVVTVVFEPSLDDESSSCSGSEFACEDAVMMLINKLRLHFTSWRICLGGFRCGQEQVLKTAARLEAGQGTSPVWQAVH